MPLDEPVTSAALFFKEKAVIYKFQKCQSVLARDAFDHPRRLRFQRRQFLFVTAEQGQDSTVKLADIAVKRRITAPEKFLRISSGQIRDDLRRLLVIARKPPRRGSDHG